MFLQMFYAMAFKMCTGHGLKLTECWTAAGSAQTPATPGTPRRPGPSALPAWCSEEQVYSSPTAQRFTPEAVWCNQRRWLDARRAYGGILNRSRDLVRQARQQPAPAPLSDCAAHVAFAHAPWLSRFVRHTPSIGQCSSMQPPEHVACPLRKWWCLLHDMPALSAEHLGKPGERWPAGPDMVQRGPERGARDAGALDGRLQLCHHGAPAQGVRPGAQPAGAPGLLNYGKAVVASARL